jgi:hypothetical protein
MVMNRVRTTALPPVTVLTMFAGGPAYVQPRKRNILVIWVDDIDWYNIRA